MNAPLGQILVADQDLTSRNLMVGLLEHEGYTVEQVAHTSEALARLSASVFDLLIADVDAPGDQCLAVLRDQDAVPVLIVTAELKLDTALAALRGAAVDYLTKPVSPAQLLSRVGPGVARGRAMRSLETTLARLHQQIDAVASLREWLKFVGVKRLPISEPTLPYAIAQALSPREREVLLAFQMTPQPARVATRLHISPHTVKNHLKSIFRKLNVNSRAELLARLARGVH